VPPELCRSCGQPIRLQRVGIRLPPLKASMFDLVKRAGDLGISTEELMRELYVERVPPKPNTVKVHMWQINELLVETEYSIVSDRRRWFLRKAGVVR
jgi:hypothetical protein